MPQRITQQAVYPEQVPRPVKRQAGRVATDATPVNIRADKTLTVDDATRQYIRTRLARKLGKFERRLERVTVRFSDINGPRGGVDIVCRIKVVLSGLPSVVVEQHGTAPVEAFDLAADSAPVAVRRAVGRVSERYAVS